MAQVTHYQPNLDQLYAACGQRIGPYVATAPWGQFTCLACEASLQPTLWPDLKSPPAEGPTS